MSVTDTSGPARGVSAGVDWAKDDYAVCVLDGDGELADTVRTDRRRLTPLVLDSDATTALRKLCRARKDMVAHRVAVANQLRAHLSTTVHPDREIFTTLPKAGTVRAARLLAEIGDARGRFPTAASLACLAGVAPSTRASGKARVVAFRWAVDKQLRDAVCDFAGDSRRVNPWAADLYNRARARGHDHPHAVRILAHAWIDIIWKCWTTNTPYNPDRHRALQHLISQDQRVGG